MLSGIDQPIKLKLAFQGGGAKLAALVECAAQIQELQRAGKVEIVSLAGTSAGSIVAALVACDFNFSIAKERISKLFATLESDLLVERKFFSKTFGAVKNVYNGETLYKPKALKNFVDGLFSEYIDGSTVFSELELPLSVVVTDLSTRSKKTFSSQLTPNEKVLESVVYSCFLPLIFHAHSSSTYYVDGGLCENLPVEEFDICDGIYNVAIGFDDELIETFDGFDGVKDYLERVISSSINHGVRRSENSVKCHAIIRLSPSVGTLDFKNAIDKLNEGVWRSECELALVKALLNLNKRREDENTFKKREEAQKTKLDKTREDLYEAFSILEHHRVKYLKKEISVVPYCLFPADDERSINPDKVKQIEVIKPLEPLRCYHFQLAADVDEIKRYRVVVENVKENKVISHKVFEVERTNTAVIEGGFLTTLFIFFDEYLPPEQECKITVNYSIFNTMKLLNEAAGIELMTCMNDRRQDACYEEATMVFFCPPNLENMLSMSHASDVWDVERGLKAVTGQLITSEDLASPVPLDEGISEVLAWRCQNLRFNESCCVRINRN